MYTPFKRCSVYTVWSLHFKTQHNHLTSNPVQVKYFEYTQRVECLTIRLLKDGYTSVGLLHFDENVPSGTTGIAPSP